jgi:hypothetical protein
MTMTMTTTAAMILVPVMAVLMRYIPTSPGRSVRMPGVDHDI